VEVHFFTGNHDVWVKGYFEEECGMIIHQEPLTVEIGDKLFYMGHGDGLGDSDPKFRLMRAVFRNKFCQMMFSSFHPRIAMTFGLELAKLSRQKHDREGGDPPYMGEKKEHLVIYAKDYLKEHPYVNFFVFGHRHIALDLMLSRECRVMILGDWVTQFTYAVFDGENMFLESYVEGETEV